VILINLLPPSERAVGTGHEAEQVMFSGRQFDWFSLAPKILGGLLGLMVLVTFLFFFLPNRSRASKIEKLDKEWKKIEPVFNEFKAKENEAKQYTATINEFYRIIEDRVIWSRIMYSLAKNAPAEIRFVKLTMKDEMRTVETVKKVLEKVEKGKKSKNKEGEEAESKWVEKVEVKPNRVHVITITGLVPLDGQAKIIAYKKSLEKDDYLKDVIKECKIPGITSTTMNFKSFTMELLVDSGEASRE
jgi:hypothetical protein